LKRKYLISRLPYIIIYCISNVAFSQGPYDLVNGNLIQFNDNGAWCWYQDERSVVDVQGGRLIVGSIANKNGVGGTPLDGDVHAVFFDLENRTSYLHTLKHALTSYGSGDDHNIPASLVRPDGKYLSIYAGHNNNYLSYYRIFNGSSWDSELTFDWNSMPGGSDFNTTYSNIFYLSAENRVYNFARSDLRSPNMMISGNQGDTWTYGGLLTEPDESIGYVNGYFKYASNGVNRIDFVCTEHHPRDYNTSIYHGYIYNGKSYKSDGTIMDNDITDQTAPKPADFTQVFAANTIVQEITMTRCWTIELQTYGNGTIATIFKARADDNELDHRFFYAYYNGSVWTSRYLCKAGPKLYSSEQDYVGLGAIHPDDPNTIFVSTTFDPRDDTDLGVHEIFKGVTANQGETWTWTPVTQNSVRDNIRPVVVDWDSNHTALIWLRGTYNAAQNFDMAVVGIVDYKFESIGLMDYVDATSSNTFLADGSTLVTTGPGPDKGPADDQWHVRTGFGNGSTVYTSSENEGEDAPVIKTNLTIPQEGTYDIWINFWANPDYDWRIMAGLSESEMKLFRQMACKHVESGDHNSTLVLTGGGNTYLYQAYLGRINAGAGSNLEVYVDDNPVEVGTENTLLSDVKRTWYDGISYALKTDLSNLPQNTVINEELKLEQNFPNPLNTFTTIKYALQRNALVKLKIYNVTGQEVVTLVNEYKNAGDHSVIWNALNMPSGVYFYEISAGNYSVTRKMILMK
jgi:hypothetical protein